MSTSASGFSQKPPLLINSSCRKVALLTRMSSLPCSAATRSNSAFTSLSFAWSQATAMPLPPAAVTASAVLATVPGSGAAPSCTVRPVT